MNLHLPLRRGPFDPLNYGATTKAYNVFLVAYSPLFAKDNNFSSILRQTFQFELRHLLFVLSAIRTQDFVGYAFFVYGKEEQDAGIEFIDERLHKLGVRRRNGQDIDIPKVGETLVALSLFPAPPMNPAPLKAG